MTRAGAAAVCLALAAACVTPPPDVVRDGVSIPYEEAADRDLRDAEQALAEGRLEAARELLERFERELARSRRADEAAFLLGRVYAQMGERERAALAWRGVAERFPRSPLAPEAALRAAQLYRELGRDELARRALEASRFERAGAELRARRHRLLADLARARGDYAEAVLALALTRRHLEDREALFELDVEIDELIEDRLRVAELQALVERLPRGPVHDRVLLDLARRQIERGELARALETLDRLPRRLSPADARRRRALRARAVAGTGAEYTLGLAVPLSGPYAGFGQSALRGVVLGLGIFDDPAAPYRVLVRDTGGDPERARSAVRELAERGARAIVGPMRSHVAAAAAVEAERAQVPLLTLAARDDLPFLGEYVFRLGLTASDQTPLLARYAIEAAGARRLAILYPRDAFGTGFKNLFWDEVERLGARVVGVEGYAPDAVDLQAEVKRLVGLYHVTQRQARLIEERDRLRKRPLDNAERLSDPELEALPPYVDFDALFIPEAGARVGLILPQLRFYDVRDVLLLGPENWNDPELLRIAGREARGAVFVGAFHAESSDPEVRDFVDGYRAAFARAPDLQAAQGYDAATLLRGLVESRGRLGSSELRGALGDTDHLRGVSGLIGFDENGTPRRRLKLLHVERGGVVELGRVEPGEVELAVPAAR